MVHTHEFDCPVCGAHLDSRDQLNQHCESRHPDDARSARPAGGLGYRESGGGARSRNSGDGGTRLD